MMNVQQPDQALAEGGQADIYAYHDPLTGGIYALRVPKTDFDVEESQMELEINK
jgi:hypothetical protein